MSDTKTPLDEFLERATNKASRRAIADAAGLDASTFTRQLARGRVPVQTVVAVCRAYGADFVEGFRAAGYVTADEASRMTSGGALRAATDEQLVQEILRRLQQGSASGALTDPIPAPTAEDAEDVDSARVVEGRFGRLGSRREFAEDAAAHHDEISIFEEQEQREE